MAQASALFGNATQRVRHFHVFENSATRRNVGGGEASRQRLDVTRAVS